MRLHSGLFGIRPQVDAEGKPNGLLVNPLIDPTATTSFAVEHVHCQGHSIGVRWRSSSSSSHTSKTTASVGLEVYVDGNLAARRDSIGPLRVHLA